MDNLHFHGHDERLTGLVENMPDEAAAQKIGELFSLLNDGTRLRILYLLCHCEECVTDIASAVNMSAPAVSHHLRVLKSAGIIDYRRDGKEALYTLSKSEEAQLVHQMIDDVFKIKCRQ